MRRSIVPTTLLMIATLVGACSSGATTAPAKATINVKEYQKDSDALLALQAGQVDAYFADSPVAGYYTVQHPAQFQLSGLTLGVASEGISVAKSNTGLRAAVQQALISMINDGTYLSILKKYGDDSGAITAAMAAKLDYIIAPASAAPATVAPASAAPASPIAAVPSGQLIFPGKLVICSDIPYPPQEFFDANGNPTGSDIDLGAEIAKRLGLTMEVQNSVFDTIIAALTGGKCDLVISAQNITADRVKQVDMIPYFQAGQSFIVAKGNPKNITTQNDLCGKTIGVESGTTEADYLNGTGDYKGQGLAAACTKAGIGP